MMKNGKSGAEANAEKAPVRRKSFLPRITPALIAGLAAAAATAGLFLAALLRPAPDAPPAATPAPTVPGEAEVLLVTPESLSVALSPTPAPPLYELPANAVEIWNGSVPILCLASRAEAEEVLKAYFNTFCTDTPTEKTLEASLPENVFLLDAGGKLPLTSAGDALTLLTQHPELLPVRRTVRSRTYAEGPAPAVQTETDDTLPEGTRCVVQLGCASYTARVQTNVYNGACLESTEDPAETLLKEGRGTVIRTGTLSVKAEEEPAPPEKGEERKAAEPVLLPPVQSGTLRAAFGKTGKHFENGMEYTVEEGSAVLAPGEGLVTYCAERGTYGLVIEIDHGGGYVSRLCLCRDALVKPNQRVYAGDPVASAFGTAVHYELLRDGIPADPAAHFE